MSTITSSSHVLLCHIAFGKLYHYDLKLVPHSVSDLACDFENVSIDKIEALKREAHIEKEDCQARGKGDEWEEQQQPLSIKIDDMKGF